jgi:hypothetical protein
VSQLGEKTMTVTRHAAGAYNATTGAWEEGAPSTFSFTASVQPVTPQLADMLPEGARESARFSMYAEIDEPPLITVDLAGQRRPDRVEYNGRNYWTQSIGDWSSDVDGIPHYEYVMLSVGEDEPGG